MPKLAIIDQAVSAGGVERFLHGLVGGMLELPEIEKWDVTILLNRYNTGGYKVEWPGHLRAPNIHVDYMFDDRLSRLMDRLANPKQIFGIYGTGFLQSRIPWLLRKYGTPWLRRHAGDAQLWIEHFCHQQHFDVAYFSYPYSMECPQITMPMVATPHDFNWKHKRLYTIPVSARKEGDVRTPKWLSRCRRLIVSSEFIASELRYFYPESADKVRVARPGIPGKIRLPLVGELQAYREHADLPEQFLLATGWIAPHKNQRVLFEALGRLRSSEIKIPIVFVGPHSDKLQPGCKERDNGYFRELLQVSERFDLQYGRDFCGLGYVDDFEIECLYRLATAVVMPSLYEAGSFSILEASRAQCPVVCSRIPAHVEQANLLGNNIWLFDPYDAKDLTDTIGQILKNPALAIERAKKASAMVEQVYSWRKAAKAYFSAFQEALECSGPRDGGGM